MAGEEDVLVTLQLLISHAGPELELGPPKECPLEAVVVPGPW